MGGSKVLQKQKKKNLMYRTVFTVIVIFLIVTIVILRSQISELREEYQKLSDNLNEYEYRVEELKYEASLTENEYIEKYAREVLGFHKSGEIVFRKSNGN